MVWLEAHSMAIPYWSPLLAEHQIFLLCMRMLSIDRNVWATIVRKVQNTSYTIKPDVNKDHNQVYRVCFQNLEANIHVEQLPIF